jgi:predicted nucleic acid-binding protein
VSLAIDASAVAALHFEDQAAPFEPLAERLVRGEEAFTAPNFHQELMEALRKAIRAGRTTDLDANAFLALVDSFNITPLPVHPLAGCPTWLLAERLNVSPYDAGYVAAAKARGLPLWTLDAPLINKLKRERLPWMPR